MRYHPEGYYTSELLNHLDVFHMFGTKRSTYAVETAFHRVGEIPRTKQVHGTDVIFLGDGKAKTYVGDAWLTDKPYVACAVRTADCLPILLCDPKKKIVGAIHAGWRGMAAHIIKKTVTAFLERGSQASDIYVAIGPHIHHCCFEVGRDLKENFTRQGWDLGDVCMKVNGKDHFDLKKAALMEFQQLGIEERNMDPVDLCTSCHKDLFYSYRRDRVYSGHQLSLIHLTR